MGVIVRLMTTEAAGAYSQGRERISALLRQMGDKAESTEVPACPGWSPKDVASHLTGVCADILAGRLEGTGTDPWTAVQVEERRARTLDEVLTEWAEIGPQVEQLLPSFPEWAANQMVFDLLSHEHDVSDALGLPAPDDPQAEGPALDFAANALTRRAGQLGLPPIKIVCGGRKWSSEGEGDGATVTMKPVDLLRATTGRRTADEIKTLDWGGADPTPWLPAFEIGHFKLRETPIAH